MILTLSFCAGILSAAPGCRELAVPLYDVAASPMACAIAAAQIQAAKAPLYPGATPGRSFCRERRRG